MYVLFVFHRMDADLYSRHYGDTLRSLLLFNLTFVISSLTLVKFFNKVRSCNWDICGLRRLNDLNCRVITIYIRITKCNSLGKKKRRKNHVCVTSGWFFHCR